MLLFSAFRDIFRPALYPLGYEAGTVDEELVCFSPTLFPQEMVVHRHVVELYVVGEDVERVVPELLSGGYFDDLIHELFRELFDLPEEELSVVLCQLPDHGRQLDEPVLNLYIVTLFFVPPDEQVVSEDHPVFNTLDDRPVALPVLRGHSRRFGIEEQHPARDAELCGREVPRAPIAQSDTSLHSLAFGSYTSFALPRVSLS